MKYFKSTYKYDVHFIRDFFSTHTTLIFEYTQIIIKILFNPFLQRSKTIFLNFNASLFEFKFEFNFFFFNMTYYAFYQLSFDFFSTDNWSKFLFAQ